MKRLLIKQCKDKRRWYYGDVGFTVPYLGDAGDEYKTRDPDGKIKFVRREDAEIIDDH